MGSARLLPGAHRLGGGARGQRLAAPAVRAASACPPGSKLHCRSQDAADRRHGRAGGCGRRLMAMAAAAATGTAIEKTEPAPCATTRRNGALSILAMRSTIDRPRPRPGSGPPSLPSRSNSWKITRRLFSGMPGPVSCTSMRRRRPRAGSPSAHGRCAVYLMALETRFCSTRRSSLRSRLTASAEVHDGEGRGRARAAAARIRRARAWSRSPMRNADDLRLERAGIEPRDVEQRREDVLDRVERGIDIARPARHRSPRRCARRGSR